MGLFDEIQEKAKRQNAMMARFQKLSEGAVQFNQVDVDRTTAAKSEKDKGLIKPEVNYIEDEVSDGQDG